jgi:hypothetical protein
VAATGPIEGLAELGATNTSTKGDGAMCEKVAEPAPFKSDEGLDIACL